MNLKEIRKLKKMSQKEASNFLNLPLRTYVRYENNLIRNKQYIYDFLVKTLMNYSPPNINESNNMRRFNIVIAGAGYVGLSLACLLSSNNFVTLTDIDENKIKHICDGVNPIHDEMISEFLGRFNIKAKLSEKSAYRNADIVIVSTPTDFNKKTKTFDTSSIENVLDLIFSCKKKPIILIKSTIPVGYTKKLILKYKYNSIFFSPEFLREGTSLHDSLYPSRIVVGYEHNKSEAVSIANIFKAASRKHDVPVLLTTTDEAETIKLFSNAYLAMRVAFFNELDEYSEQNNINSKCVIKGVSLDPRIGDFYNNPSFGYGGYCLPKDVAQLANDISKFSSQNLIRAIEESNLKRKEFIASQIIKKSMKICGKSKSDIIIGVYLLSMKRNSDNHRYSSTIDVINILKKNGLKIIIFDPNYNNSEKDFSVFLKSCDFYIANRYDKKIKGLRNLLYTRDIFNFE